MTSRQPLSATHPDLASQWHPTKNGNRTPDTVTAGSSSKVWWVCAKGHEWDDTPNHRTSRGSGCAVCAGKRIQIGYNDLAHTHGHLAAQWHPTRNGMLRPFDITAGSGKKVWWQDSVGHEWQAQVNNRANGSNCPYCSNRAVLKGFNDLAKKHPVCAGQMVLAGFNDMATTRPDLAAEWHPTLNAPLTPRDVFRSVAKKFWWMDLLGHEWEASANERSNGSNCPFCSGQRILVGFNDLATRNPELASEWHPELNGERTPQMVTLMNGTKAWWRDSFGHEWEAVISSRSVGTGCPVCSGSVVVVGVNDLASRHPAVAATWHPTKNGNVTPSTIAVYSNRKMWFVCDAGHEWLSTVNNRTHGQSCPEGAEGGGFNPGRPGYVYFIEHLQLGAYKVGITNVDSNRLAHFQLRGWQVLNLELFERGADAAAVEQVIKRWWRLDLKLGPWLGQADMPTTGGWSETVCADEISAIECINRIHAERRRRLESA